MKKIVILSLVLALGGCANLKTAWEVVTSAAATPQQILVASNAFDGLETQATAFKKFCDANKGNAACAPATLVSIKKAFLSGRAARNALEPYVVSGTAGPAALYNTLVAAVTTLESTVPSTTPGATP